MSGEGVGQADLDAIRQSYRELPDAEWFREVYEGASLGEVIEYADDASTAPTNSQPASTPARAAPGEENERP